jgi:uncharacterized damage-inducible protein DinB
MRKISALVLGLALLSVSSWALPQSAPSPDKTPPSYDLKPQALLDLQQMQKKFVGLATAIPAAKYTWRPAPDVRSISEVFLHVSATTYQLAPMMGAAPLPGFQLKGFDESTTAKDKIIDQLNHSFDYLRAAIEKMSNDDLKKPVKELGPEASVGDVIYEIVIDAHEHLGQSIAYARLNGVVPPWTVNARKKAAQQPKR